MLNKRQQYSNRRILQLNLSFRVAELYPHEFLENLFTGTPGGFFLHSQGAMPEEQAPYAKTDSIEQRRVFGTQGCH